MKSAKRNTFSVRVTDNLSGRSVSFTIAAQSYELLGDVVRRVHGDAVSRNHWKVTNITDRRHARR